MDRRDFLKASSLFIAAGMVLPKAAKSMLARNSEQDNFSLEVICNNSDLATRLLENLIKKGNFGIGNFNYSEYPVAGAVMGDLVFVRNNELINYTLQNDNISNELKEIRNKLSLPSILYNPVRMRLYKNSGESINKIIVTQKGKIISKLNASEQDNYTFYGKAGKFTLDVKNQTAKVKETSCRHKICQNMSAIKKQGDYIICIPNGLHIFAE